MSIKPVPKWINCLEKSYLVCTLKNSKEKIYCSNLHIIARGLFQAIKEKNTRHTNKILVKKIKVLANNQLEYYKTCTFSFVLEFFSALRNLFVFGKFHSSAYLAKSMAEDILNKLKKEKEHSVKKPPQIEKLQTLEPSEKKLEVEEKNSEETSKEKEEKVEEHQLDQSMDTSLSLKETLFRDLQKVWSMDDQSASFFNNIWERLLKNSDVKRWEKKNDKHFTIILNKSMIGKYNFLIKFKLQEIMEFSVHEQGSKKIVDFTVGEKLGLTGPFGTHLKIIEIDEIDNKLQATFVIEGGGAFAGEYALSPTEALAYMDKVVWR